MKIGMQEKLLLLLPPFILFFAGLEVISAIPYDYSATIECVEEPHKPQYGGGIIKNPELNDGLKGWSAFGKAKIQQRESDNANKFIVAHTRKESFDSVSHKINMQKSKLYTFSAWIRVSEGKAPVTAVFKTVTGLKPAGAVVAESNCWSMLKGGLTVNASGPAILYFESKNTSVEIWVDSVSLQPFTPEEWRSHQDERIEKMRKRRVKIVATDAEGNPLPNATVSIDRKDAGKPFGCATNKNILNNPAYQQWFTSRFGCTTFEDEMKWYSTEPTQGKEDYSVPDAMINVMKQHNIQVRGHNVLWDDPSRQPNWVGSLSPADLSTAATRRINSIMSKYKGQIIGWDVVNENIHFSFFEDKLGKNASGLFYKLGHDADGEVPLFINEFNTLEQSGDKTGAPPAFLQKIKEIQSFPGSNAGNHLAIGLESHFDSPNLPYVRSSLDTLAASKLPIWLTEVDVKAGPNQAADLEKILREGHGHPAVRGIVIWAAWKPEGCYRMCLTDNNFKNLATGDVVDKLIKEWGVRVITGTTNSDGIFETSLYNGDYQVKITHSAALGTSSLPQKFEVKPLDNSSSDDQTIMLLRVFV